jgi:hypothetical protein
MPFSRRNSAKAAFHVFHGDEHLAILIRRLRRSCRCSDDSAKTPCVPHPGSVPLAWDPARFGETEISAPRCARASYVPPGTPLPFRRYPGDSADGNARLRHSASHTAGDFRGISREGRRSGCTCPPAGVANLRPRSRPSVNQWELRARSTCLNFAT